MRVFYIHHYSIDGLLKCTMKIIRTCKILVGQKRSYSLRLEERYVRLVLWFFNVQDQQPFLTLMERIVRLNKDSGYKYSVPYLKECLRLIQHWKSGNPTIALKGDIRVASKRGLPLILPSSLRIQLERSEPQVLRIVLTLISIFRIYKYPSVPTLSTITGPFTGVSSTLDWGEIRRIRTLFNSFVPLTVPKGREELIPLRTAGPNFKRSILGAPLDAYAWRLASEELRSSFKVLSDYFGSSLAEKLEEESNIVHSLPLK